MTVKHLVLLFGAATLGSISFPEPADAASPAFECPHAFTPSSPAKLVEVQRLLPEAIDDCVAGPCGGFCFAI
jgi:hypothetical protein